MSSDRREFLQRLALGGIALGSLPTVLDAAVAPSSAGTLSAHALLRGMPAQGTDVTWPKRLTGKHKAVFDSPDIGGGLGVLRAGIVAAQYAQTFNEPASAFSGVIVLRHTGIHLAMNPQYWSTYKIGKKYKATHPLTEKPIDVNPALLTEADGLPGMLTGFTLDKLLAGGTIVLACALAYGDVVDVIAKADKLNEDAATAKANSMLLPGIIMQPSGVFATTLAQENGCVYVRAT